MAQLEYVFRHHHRQEAVFVVEREGDLEDDQQDTYAEDILKDVVSNPQDWYLSDVFDTTPGQTKENPTEVKYCY
jgi:hypothetical protein